MPSLLRRLSLVLAAGALLFGGSLQAAPPPAYELHGTAFNGQVFDLSRQRGRVVMVVYWATDCAVCRSKLPELRANLRGWAERPFDLVTVSLDRKEADWRDYEQIKASTQAKAAQRSVALWVGMSDFRHSLGSAKPKLPLTLVIDTQGQVVQRFEGRMAPEAWDAVAELLP